MYNGSNDSLKMCRAFLCGIFAFFSGCYAQELSVSLSDAFSEALTQQLREIELSIQESAELYITDLLNEAQQRLIPAYMRSLFEKIKLMAARIERGTPEYPNSFKVSGSTTLYGERVDCVVWYVDQGNTISGSIDIALPASKRIKDIFPGLPVVGDLAVERMRFVCTNFSYKDTKTDITLDPAFHMLGTVQLASLKIPGIKKIANLLKEKAEAPFHIVLSPDDITKSRIDITIPPIMLTVPDVTLASLFDIGPLKMPNSMRTALQSVRFKNISMAIDFSQTYAMFSLGGTIDFFNVNANALFKMFETESDGIISSFVVRMPSSWSLSSAFPDLSKILQIKTSNITFAVSSGSYMDSTFNIHFDPGVFLLTGVDISLIGSNPLTKILNSIAGKNLTLFGQLLPDLSLSRFNIAFDASASENKFSLADLLNFNSIRLPHNFEMALSKTSFSLPKINFEFGERRSCDIEGDISLFGKNIFSQIRFVKIKDEWLSNFILHMPEGFKFSDMIPEFKAFDSLSLGNIKLADITVPFTDFVTNINYDIGVNIDGKINFNGVLKQIGKIVNLTQIRIKGLVDDKILDTILRVKIPKTTMKFGGIKTGPLTLRVSLRPTFGLETNLKLPVPGSSQDLIFNALIDILGDTGNIAAWMDGEWKNPLGIKGLTLRNVGLEGSCSFITLTPSGLGLRSEMDIGNKTMTFAAKGALGMESGEIALMGSLDGGLYFNDLIRLTGKMVGAVKKVDFFKVVSKKLPKIGLDDIEIILAPTATTIAGKKYKQGVSGECGLRLLGARGRIFAEMGENGIKGNGSLQKVSLGPLRLTSFDGETGPAITINISDIEEGMPDSLLADNVGFTLDGKLELKILGGLSAATQCSIGIDGVAFRMVSKLFSLFEADIQGIADVDDIKKANLEGTFKQSALTKLNQLLVQAARDFINKAKKDLAAAEDAIHHEFDEKIEKQRALVKEEQEKAINAMEDLKRKTREAVTKEIDKTKGNIERVKEKISKAKRRCKKAKWYRKADKCAKSGIELSAYYTELGALELYLKGLLKPGRVFAPEMFGIAGDIIDIVPVDLDPRVSVLLAARETALAGIKVGEIGAKTIKTVTKFIAELGDQAFNFKEIQFKGGIENIAQGALPEFSLKGTAFGQGINLKEVKLDFGDLVKTTEYLVKKVIKLIT